MPRWYPVEPADDVFLRAAPQRHRFEIDLPVPPERVWQSLTSEQSMAAWGPGVRSVRWLTPLPFGIGTQREVVLPLGVVSVRERFYRWDEGTRFSFHVIEANRPGIVRFAEDYAVTATPSGARLTWTIAVQLRPALLNVATLPLNRLSFGAVAASAKRYFARVR